MSIQSQHLLPAKCDPFAFLGKAICEEQQQKVEALQADAAQAGIQKELGVGSAFTWKDVSETAPFICPPRK